MKTNRNWNTTAKHGLAAIFIAGALLLAGPLHAYMPGRWSPLDVYVLQGKSAGPKVLKVVRGGKSKQAARLIYDGSGRLVKEVYQGARGGETRYVYEGKRLVSESLIDGRGRTLTRKVFQYNKNGLLSMQVYNRGNKLIMSQLFSVKNSRIVSGKEISGRNYDRFFIRYKKGKPVLQRVLKEDGKEISRVTFKYRKDGKIHSRIRRQNGTLSRCLYEYDGSGRLTSYTYYRLEGKTWRKDKKLVLGY